METVGEEAEITYFTEIVFIAVDCDSPTVLKDWYNQEMNRLHDFFYQATFGYFRYDNIVLKKDENNAFMMPNPYEPPFSHDCEHVHSVANMQAVLQEADDLYDYSAYDFDNDGKVYVHFTSIGPKSGGIVSSCLTYQSDDGVDVVVNKQSRGSNKGMYMGVFKHESGHEFFSFPDMEHGDTNYDHYGIGSFDIMSGPGFDGIASLYNPFFRDARNWFHPYYIMEDWENARLKDFQMYGSCYIYKPYEINNKALPHEKFYISYHKHDEINNYYYSSWPYKERELGGMLIWHVKTKQENVGTSGDYSDWRRLDVDIEYAHGKYKWDIYPDRVENTFEPDPYTGRDSLEIRLVDSEGHVTGGPFYGRAAGNNGAFYTPGDGKNFTFASNPNSNWYNKEATQNYAQNITNGFAVKNLRKEGDQIYADFYFSDYTIENDLTINTPHLYISGNVIVDENASLTIEPGVTLHFDDDCKMTVNGCLIANGTEAEPIVFTSSQDAAGKSSWNGLKLEDYTYSEFNHCRFEYAAGGLSFYEGAISSIKNCEFFSNYKGLSAPDAMPEVQNCTFESNTVGLSFRSCYTSQNWNFAPVENCSFIANGYGIQMFFDASTVANCNISDSYYHGLHIYGSNLVLMNNIIDNSSRYGLYVTNGSSPDLYNNGYVGGHNRITGSGGYGVYNAYGCLSELGDFSFIAGQDRSGYNDIYDNTDYEIYNKDSQTLYAEGNWWGEAYSCTTSSDNGTDSAIPNPEPPLYGDVSWCPALNAPATSSSPENAFSSQDSSESSYELPQKLQQARYLEMSAEYEQAAELLKKYIQDSPSPAYISYAALKYSKNLKNFLPVQETISSYKDLLSEAKTDVTEFELCYNLIHLLINDRDYTDAMNITYSLLEGELSKENWCRVKLQQAIIEIYFNENRGAGDDIFNEILERDSIPEFYKEFVNSEKGITNFAPQKSIANHNISVKEKINPETFEFFGNYPNPFNPETNFSFKLPVESQVKIKIFNTSGEKIKEISGLFNSGYDLLKWDGRNNMNYSVPSGMYIYKFVAYPYDKNRKPYIKNGKMILLNKGSLFLNNNELV